jgi:adenosylhomocysteinase
MPNAEYLLDDLRQGLPIREGAEDFIVGHSLLLKVFEKALNDLSTGKITSVSRYLLGPTGAGKSTLLMALKSKGFSKGFGVSELYGDQRSGTLTEISYFVQEIFRSFKAKIQGEVKNWQGFLDEFSNHIILEMKEEGMPETILLQVSSITKRIDNVFKKFPFAEPSLVEAVTTYVVAKHQGGEKDIRSMRKVIEWFLGEKLSLAELSNLGVTNKINDRNALSILQTAVYLLKETGFAGLIILMDEVAQTMSQRLDTQVKRSFYLIQQLVDKRISGVFSCFASLDEIIDGEYWHSIPVMSESLLRRLGLEDNDDVKVPNPFGVAYQILPVNDEESRIIQNKLIGLYKEVYGWSDENCGHANEKLQESKQNDSEEYPGEVIRRSIKVLDRLLLEENFKDPL